MASLQFPIFAIHYSLSKIKNGCVRACFFPPLSQHVFLLCHVFELEGTATSGSSPCLLFIPAISLTLMISKLIYCWFDLLLSGYRIWVALLHKVYILPLSPSLGSPDGDDIAPQGVIPGQVALVCVYTIHLKCVLSIHPKNTGNCSLRAPGTVALGFIWFYSKPMH